MRGQVITKIPSEFASAAVDGVVVSADGVYDYILQQNLESLNAESINNEKITALALVSLDTRKSDKLEVSNIENKIKDEILTNEEILSAAINFINNIKADKLDIYNEEEKRILEDERLLELINNLNNTLNSIIGTSDATSAIDTFNEIITFLNGIEDTNLQSIISTVNNSILSTVNTEKTRALGVEQNISQSLQTHTSNNTVHITSQERTNWNNEATYRELNELNIAKAINLLNNIKANKEDINDLKETINNSLKESEQIISESLNQLNNTKANKIELDNKADLTNITELKNIILENEKIISNTLNVLNDNKVEKDYLRQTIRDTMCTIIENELIISNAINELNRTKASVKDLDNLFETVYLLEQRVTNLE